MGIKDTSYLYPEDEFLEIARLIQSQLEKEHYVLPSQYNVDAIIAALETFSKFLSILQNSKNGFSR